MLDSKTCQLANTYMSILDTSRWLHNIIQGTHVRGETQWPMNAQGHTEYINALLFTDTVPNRQLGSPRSIA